MADGFAQLTSILLNHRLPGFYFIVFVLGTCVGSFLNVLALRSLEEKSPLWPLSHCPKCQHQLAVYDLIPIFSYLMLKGKCRYCSTKIAWYYPVTELLTGIAFLIVFLKYTIFCNTLGMLIFTCTLIAVCITDFKAKLIPHDITYPSMLMGIVYSGICRHDILGTLAGIGMSYILFDFLAFYGLKMYMAAHKTPGKHEPNQDVKTDLDTKYSATDDEIDDTFSLSNQQVAEEIEVMGGGDAVLAAVIAAWLGWERLITALIASFIAGTIIGALYLVNELHKKHLLKKCLVQSVTGAVIATIVLEGCILGLFSIYSHPLVTIPWIAIAICTLFSGVIIGIILTGSRVSKPFPFGPALAIGGLTAMLTGSIETTKGI